jgi:hypothetical protein
MFRFIFLIRARLWAGSLTESETHSWFVPSFLAVEKVVVGGRYLSGVPDASGVFHQWLGPGVTRDLSVPACLVHIRMFQSHCRPDLTAPHDWGQVIWEPVMRQQDMPTTEPPSTEPEIIPPGADWQRRSRIWVSTGQDRIVRLQITPLGAVGFPGFVLLIVILAIAGIALLLGAALVGVAAAGVLIIGGIVSAVLRRQFRR